jgi:predicted AAA+ superfamily ATPase
MSRLDELKLKMRALVIFRNLLDDEVFGRLLPLLEGDGKSTAERISDYARFVSALFREGEDLGGVLLDRVLTDENCYVARITRGDAIGPALEACLVNELQALEDLSRLSAREVREAIGYDGYLPEWTNGARDFTAAYRSMLSRLSTTGYGIFARHVMFSLRDGEIVPVGTPDAVRLSDLKGYDRERRSVIDNTVALLEGKPAANALLYGDAGTGKSSTIKAVVNEFASRGLRLIEIRKNQLMEIPRVVESLKHNPLKFILFIDDLSFSAGSEAVGALKAILEGAASARTKRVVIYATSNRRHIVCERFSDRGDDDVHINETIQEQVSLSQRFGLSVAFLRPDRERYLEIVRGLARDYGILESRDLEAASERYAIERGGRSPRVARQFVESLKRMEA